MKPIELKRPEGRMVTQHGFSSRVHEACNGEGCDECYGGGTEPGSSSWEVFQPAGRSLLAEWLERLRGLLALTLGDISEVTGLPLAEVSEVLRGQKVAATDDDEALLVGRLVMAIRQGRATPVAATASWFVP